MSKFEENDEERSKIRLCPECTGKLIKFGGSDWNRNTDQHFTFTVGRVCKRCDILYINPVFEVCKIIYSKLGARH